MSNLSMRVDLVSSLNISMGTTGTDNDPVLTQAFSVGASESASSGHLCLDDGTTVEVIFKAAVQPCVVLGIRSPANEGVSIVARADKQFRLVVAVGSTDDPEGYNEPVIDRMYLGDQDNRVNLVLPASKAE